MHLSAYKDFQDPRLMLHSRLFLALLWSILAVWCVAQLTTAASAKPHLELVSSIESDSLPLANPDFQHPDEPSQVFFLQRSTNANTVVYTARFSSEGTLKSTSPVFAFWRRYADDGQAMDLRWYERLFGFGVRVRSHPEPNSHNIAFNALKSHDLELRQRAPFEAALFTVQNGREYQLIYGYLDVDESGLLPKVTHLHLYTTDAQTGRYVTHTIAVSGGAFKE